MRPQLEVSPDISPDASRVALAMISNANGFLTPISCEHAIAYATSGQVRNSSNVLT